MSSGQAVGNQRGKLPGRSYQAEDLPLVLGAGLGSALCSIVVFLIYLGAVVGGELIVSKVLSERIQGRKRIALIVGIGAPFGFGAAYCIYALVRLVSEML